MSNTGTKASCTCDNCVAACQYKPGWFKFGEIEKAAAHLGISLQEFFDKYLMVEYWIADDDSDGKDVFLPSLITAGQEPARIADWRFRPSPCVFLKDRKCSIHAVKPFECASMLHGEDNRINHVEAMKSWNNPEAQAQIVTLLGYAPTIPEHDILDILLMAIFS